MTQPQVPDRARVVVIGGGVIGCSVAYHLAQAGCEVVLLERDQLTSGTTWHAAGLMVTFGSMSSTSTRLRQDSRDLYTRLGAETGQSTGFRPVGFIEAAATADRLHEYRRIAAFNRHLGVPVEEISPAEVAQLFPLARTDDLHAGFYVAGDGRVNPVDVTMALAKGARMHGARLLEGVPVQAVLTRPGRGRAQVTGVRTPFGDIEAETVVNCAGMWARQLGEQHGVSIPLQAAEHYYLITDTIQGLDPQLPVFEDPHSYGYYREEGGGLMIGLFEPVAAAFSPQGIPEDLSFASLRPDLERLEPFLATAMARVPVAGSTGIRTLFCGPESFTPDLAPIVGQAPELGGYFVAAGLNSIGILTGGGLGRAVAHWVLNGSPDIDVTGIAIDRLDPRWGEHQHRVARVVENVGRVYASHYPFEQCASARGLRLSPAHQAVAAVGARFTQVSAWESPLWFDQDAAGPAEFGAAGPEVGWGEPTWGRPAWFGAWQAEHRAVRETAGVLDMSFMAVYEVTGADAAAFLERLSTNRVAQRPGRVTYTTWLDHGGCLQADLTVMALGPQEFRVIASDTAARHVGAWMLAQLDAGEAGEAGPDVQVRDVTDQGGLLSVQGPAALPLLQSLTEADLEALAFGDVAPITVAGVSLLCARLTYVGERGYELHCQAQDTAALYDALLDAGAASGVRPVGLAALSSLRLERGYRDYGHDLDNLDSPLEAGLGFIVAWDKPGGFIGEQALAERRERGITESMVSVLLTDPEPLVSHGEVLYRDGEAVGYLRVGSYGHTLGGAVGLAMVGVAALEPGRSIQPGVWEVDVAGTRYPASVSRAPFYDPSGKRAR